MPIDAAELPFRELLDAAPDGLIVCDQQSRVLLVNAEVVRMFGYTREELLGQHIDLLVPDRARVRHGEHFAGYVRNPQPRPMGISTMLTGRCKDASEIPVEISLAPIRTKRGPLVTASIRDVTDRRKLERDSRRATAFLVSAAESARDALMLCDEQDHVVMVNSAARRLFGGVAGEALVGMTFEQLIDTALAAGLFDSNNETRDALRSRWLAYHREPVGVLDLRTMMGDHLRVSDSTTGGYGTVSTIADITTDIEREGRLEHLYQITKLFASCENVEQTFDPMLGIVGMTLPLHSAILVQAESDRSAMIVWSSLGHNAAQMQVAKQRAEASYRYLVGSRSPSPSDHRERSGRTTLPPQESTEENPARRFITVPLVVAHRRPFGVLQLEAAQALDKTDLRFVNAIGSQLAVALDRDRARRRDVTRREHAEEGRTHAETLGATAERERAIAAGSSAKYEALALDNARLYEQAQQAVQMREQILAIVSHDLRNPLGTILMAASMLAPSETLEVEQNAGRIQRAADRSLRLIEDLLDFASIEAGRLAIKTQPHEAGPLVRDALAGFEGIALKKQLSLRAEVDAHLPRIPCDRDRIQQVLSNLVGNAANAAAVGGTISVRVDAPGSQLVFAVADNGPGISAADLPHLFERYWRSSEAQYKGTGLGLAIAKGIVDAHGGSIRVESEIGRGTTFFIALPLSDGTDE